MDDAVPEVDLALVHRLQRLAAPLVAWHRFQVVGMQHVPATGPCLLVVHHSLATYDGFLLGGAIFEATGRLPRGLGDDTIFEIPGLADLARRIGIVPASPAAGEAILRAGELLGVAPGGMWEALRPRREARRSRWQDRKGFVRLALRTGTPILVSACPRADDLYTVYGSRLTDAAYRRFHLPVPIARGFAMTPLPRPLALTAFLAPVVVPPPWDAEREAEQVDDLHVEVSAVMAGLLRHGG